MLYVIYELVASSSLGKLEGEEGNLKVLRKISWDIPLHEHHSSFEGAFKEIEQHAKELRNRKFVVLPTISVDYEGNIE